MIAFPKVLHFNFTARNDFRLCDDAGNTDEESPFATPFWRIFYTVSTFIRFVLPEAPLMSPAVITTLSPSCK